MTISGSSLRKLRLDAKLTQKRLANLAGVSQAHIAKIEQEKVDPRLSTVNRVLRVLSEAKEKRCGDIMVHGVLFAKPNDSVLDVSEVMVKNAISQMPVVDENRIVGTITEESIVRKLGSNVAFERVKNVMDPPLPTVPEETGISTLKPLLERRPGVLIMRGKKVIGIITRSDLLKTIG